MKQGIFDQSKYLRTCDVTQLKKFVYNNDQNYFYYIGQVNLSTNPWKFFFFAIKNILSLNRVEN